MGESGSTSQSEGEMRVTVGLVTLNEEKTIPGLLVRSWRR